MPKLTVSPDVRAELETYFPQFLPERSPTWAGVLASLGGDPLVIDRADLAALEGSATSSRHTDHGRRSYISLTGETHRGVRLPDITQQLDMVTWMLTHDAALETVAALAGELNTRLAELSHDPRAKLHALRAAPDARLQLEASAAAFSSALSVADNETKVRADAALDAAASLMRAQRQLADLTGQPVVRLSVETTTRCDETLLGVCFAERRTGHLYAGSR